MLPPLFPDEAGGTDAGVFVPPLLAPPPLLFDPIVPLFEPLGVTLLPAGMTDPGIGCPGAAG